MSTSEQQARHKKRMQKKKTLVDAGIKRADREQGLLLVLTGNGKGKSSSAVGMVARALGHGMTVAVAQFIKGRDDTGEDKFFRQHSAVQWHRLGEGFTWETQNLEGDKETARRGWGVVKKMLQDPMLDLTKVFFFCIRFLCRACCSLVLIADVFHY